MEQAHSWCTLSNLHTAGEDREEVGKKRQRLVGKSSPYWLGQGLDTEDDKSGASTVERKNDREIHKRAAAEGKGSGGKGERERDTGMEGKRESCIINLFAS